MKITKRQQLSTAVKKSLKMVAEKPQTAKKKKKKIENKKKKNEFFLQTYTFLTGNHKWKWGDLGKH